MPRIEQPLPADGGVLGEFAAELRRLRQKAGTPPYRELARRALFSATTLADAAGGRRLPSLPVVLAFVRSCNGDVREWESRWRLLAAELARADGREPGTDTDDKSCPYLGLASYGTGDADRFFGREVLTRQLVEAVRTRRFVGVVGASGCGKSSLLHAGLQAWATRPAPEGPRWRCLDFTPGAHPLQECAARLASLSGVSAASLFRDLQTSPEALHLSVLQILAADRPDSQLLIVIDQFEELFTLCTEEDQRESFIAALAGAANAGNSRARVVIGVRADFYAHCARHPALVDLLQGAQLLVGPMTGEELRTAVSRPAAGVGCAVEAALQARVVADAAGQPAALPLVSHAMREAWRRRRGNTLTLAGYEACGGITNALARTAETAYTGLPGNQQRVARQLLLRLVRVGPNEEVTKQRLDRRELDAGTTEVLTALVGARLLAVDADSVQITHEALLSAWPRLRSWIEQNRAGLLVRQQLVEAAAIWAEAGCDPGLLLRSGRLALAAEWAAGHGDDIRAAPTLSGYLSASRRRATLAARVRKLVVATLTALSVLTMMASVVAFEQRVAARAAQNRVVADEMAEDVPALLSQDGSMAALVELASYRISHDANTGTDLMSTEHQPLARVLDTSSDEVGALGYSRDGKVLATSGGVDTDGKPAGKHLAAAGNRNEVRLWDAGSSAPLTAPLLADEPISGLTFSADDKVLVGSGAAGVRLWDTSDPRDPAPLDISSTGLARSQAVCASFSAKGRLLATANGDGVVDVWDMTDPSRPRSVSRFPSGGGGVTSAMFVRDGLLATSGPDGTIRLWDLNHPHSTPTALIGNATDGSGTRAVAFSPDGTVMALADNDYTVRLWSLANPARPTALGRPLTGFTGAVEAVAFSSDGDVLATAGADHAVRLWNVADPAAAVALGQPLTGHTDPVDKVAFRPGGRELASADGGGAVRVWTLPGTVLVGHTAPVTALAYRPDGQVLASGGDDATIRLWDVTDPWHPSALGDGPQAGDMGTVSVLTFRPDGAVLVGGSQDGAIRLWDVSEPAHLRAIGALQTGFQGAVTCLSFSPDGRTLAASAQDGTVRLWDLSNPAAPTTAASPLYKFAEPVHVLSFSPDGSTLTAGAGSTVRRWLMTRAPQPVLSMYSSLAGVPDGMTDLALSPDGDTLAAVGPDADIGLWDMSAWAAHKQAPREATPTGDTRGVTVVAFSPYRHTLAGGADDGTLRLWDTADPTEATPRGSPITGHNAAVDAMAFSPDGSSVATAGDDHTVQITVLDPDAAGRNICSMTGGAADRHRWHRYLPKVRYEDPCR
ncbi:WD40 repeat protein [Catenulispora sp. GAS73]|uniref:nSTAND1 domain-containing NTPase n=1 Tax=Catenulispora sp. GAS73 TaxID=3156269 RepID=UPI003513777F